MGVKQGEIMRVGYLVKVVTPNHGSEWQKDKLAIILSIDKDCLTNNGFQNQYGLYFLDTGDICAWFWDNQIEFVNDFFKEYRTYETRERDCSDISAEEKSKCDNCKYRSKNWCVRPIDVNCVAP